jgi:hypothetical protein
MMSQDEERKQIKNSTGDFFGWLKTSTAEFLMLKRGNISARNMIE